MKKTYDVAVVGASIAGCTAATLFARRGARVALIERHTDPNAYKALCTHFIQPSAVPTIERLGLKPLIEEAGAVRNGLEMWTRWGWIRPPKDAPEHAVPHGYSIRREVLDPMLRRLAAETSGVDFMPGWSVRDLIRADRRITGIVVRDRAGKAQEIGAKLVVAADGRNSRMAELAGVPARVKPNNRFIYFAHYRNLSLASGKRSQMWMLEPDVAYTFPNDGDVTLLTCMPAKDKLPGFKKDLEGSFVRFFQDLPEGPSLADAERVSKIMGSISLENVSRPAAKDGLALVGDAALWSDVLWGVGCGWAFQSAQWLVDLTADAVTNGGDLDLNRYRKQHRSRLAGHHLLVSDFSKACPYTSIEKLMFSAAARDEQMTRHFHAFGSRLIGVREFLAPKAVGRALWVNARHRIGRQSIPAPTIGTKGSRVGADTGNP